MKFLDEVSEQGVTERHFELQVAGERVPGILWHPTGANSPRQLLLQGHGGTQNKRVLNILSLARRMVRHHGYAVAAIDAPGHGDRMTPEEAAAARERGSSARSSGCSAFDPVLTRSWKRPSASRFHCSSCFS